MSSKPTKYTQNGDYIWGANSRNKPKFANFFWETICLLIEKSKLVKRERRMSGKIFIEICFKEVLAHGLLSTLRNFCQRAGKDYDILDFREESFNGRFNASSVACAEDILKRLLSEKFSQTMKMKCLEEFSHIFIEDSTSEKLNTKLADLFPGTVESGNVVAIKLDLVIDLKQSEGIIFKVKYAIFQENKDLFIKAIETNTVSNYQKYLEVVSNDLSIFGKKNVKGKNIRYSTLFKFH